MARKPTDASNGETDETPAKSEYRIVMTQDGLDITANVRTVEDADALIGAVSSFRVMLGGEPAAPVRRRRRNYDDATAQDPADPEAHQPEAA